MNEISGRLAETERRLTAAWGDPVPEAGAAILAAAESVVRQGAANRGAANPFAAETVGWAASIPPSYLPSLAAAYRAGGDERFAATARCLYEAYLAQFRDEDPWMTGGHYDPLLVPHRLGDTEVAGWFGALPPFLRSPAFDEAFVGRLVESARIQLNHTAGRVHEARNIRMTQCDCLFTQGMRLAFLPDAAAWREAGLRGLNDCFHRQFNPDGSSIEATGWYHYICLNMALRFLRLKERLPEPRLQVTRALVLKALDYVVALVQPDGEFIRIGDCTGGVYPFKTLDEVLAFRRSIRSELGCADEEPPREACFPDAGQAMLREGWTPRSMLVTFDATRRDGYHWHPGFNAVQIHAFGRRLVADPGRMSYGATPQRRFAVSTAGHSTMTYNGWDQSHAPGRLAHVRASGYHVVQGQYTGGYWQKTPQGYGPGLFGEHHRTLLWAEGRFVAVLDNLSHMIEAERKPDVVCTWQFAPGRVEVDTARRRAVYTDGGAGLLALFPLLPAGAETAVREGETEPPAGWVAVGGDTPAPAPQLSIRAAAYDSWNADLATVFIPFAGSVAPDVEVGAVTDPAAAGYGRFELRWPDGSRDDVWWTRRLKRALERVDGIGTDSALVHIGRSASGRAGRGLVFEGSFLEPWAAAPLSARRTFTLGQEA